MMDADFTSICSKLGQLLQQKNQSVVTAESCTGGWVAQVMTSIAGSSTWFERGFVTYSNRAKQDMLGVQAVSLQQYGAVSEAVAREMAAGAVANSRGDFSVAITGIAGPDGGSAEKPVGLVWFAVAGPGGTVQAIKQIFDGDRKAVRTQAVSFALQELLCFIKKI